MVNYGISLVGEGDSVTGHCYPPSGKRFVKSAGAIFCVLHSSHRKTSQQTVFRSRSECDKQLRILQRQKREYEPTLINTALRQMVAMLQHQVGAQHSQYFLVLVRRISFDKDYIVAATIISFARPLLYAIATAKALTERFFF